MVLDETCQSSRKTWKVRTWNTNGFFYTEKKKRNESYNFIRASQSKASTVPFHNNGSWHVNVFLTPPSRKRKKIKERIAPTNGRIVRNHAHNQSFLRSLHKRSPFAESAYSVCIRATVAEKRRFRVKTYQRRIRHFTHNKSNNNNGRDAATDDRKITRSSNFTVAPHLRSQMKNDGFIKVINIHMMMCIKSTWFVQFHSHCIIINAIFILIKLADRPCRHSDFWPFAHSLALCYLVALLLPFFLPRSSAKKCVRFGSSRFVIPLNQIALAVAWLFSLDGRPFAIYIRVCMQTEKF